MVLMEPLNILLLIAFIVFAFYLYWSDRKIWKVAHENTYNAAPYVYSLYSYLKEHNIQCRMKATMTSYILEVHKKDLKVARKLIKEYNKNTDNDHIDD